MSFSRKDMQAKWTLGWALMKHLLLMLLPGTRDHGPRPWLGRLLQENLAATPAGSWRRFEPASRCLVCGLCDVLGKPGESPSRWIAAATREPGTSPLALREIARLRELAPEIARLCPGRLAVDDLLTLVEDNAHLLGEPAGPA